MACHGLGWRGGVTCMQGVQAVCIYTVVGCGWWEGLPHKVLSAGAGVFVSYQGRLGVQGQQTKSPADQELSPAGLAACTQHWQLWLSSQVLGRRHGARLCHNL